MSWFKRLLNKLDESQDEPMSEIPPIQTDPLEVLATSPNVRKRLEYLESEVCRLSKGMRKLGVR